MPCDDVTEIMTMNLNSEDSITSYGLIKKSCGRAVGEQSLISEWVVGQQIDDFLQVTVDDFLDRFACTDETEEFLYLKHFFALQCAGQVLLGKATGAADATCAVDTIGYDEQGTEICAVLSLEVITKKIKSCGRCSGCGTKKKLGV